MGSFVTFAEITGAVLAALALSLGLEYLGLQGLMKLMPLGRARHHGGQQ